MRQLNLCGGVLRTYDFPFFKIIFLFVFFLSFSPLLVSVSFFGARPFGRAKPVRNRIARASSAFLAAPLLGAGTGELLEEVRPQRRGEVDADVDEGEGVLVLDLRPEVPQRLRALRGDENALRGASDSERREMRVRKRGNFGFKYTSTKTRNLEGEVCVFVYA